MYYECIYIISIQIKVDKKIKINSKIELIFKMKINKIGMLSVFLRVLCFSFGTLLYMRWKETGTSMKLKVYVTECFVDYQ